MKLLDYIKSLKYLFSTMIAISVIWVTCCVFWQLQLQKHYTLQIKNTYTILRSDATVMVLNLNRNENIDTFMLFNN